jgi:hypothetical protein
MVRDPAGGDSGLIVRRSDPLNCETSIQRLLGGVVMPNAHFYGRNHFPVPALHPSSWRLQVGGLVARPTYRAAQAADLGDFFVFAIQRPIASMNRARVPPVRYQADCQLAGRPFEAVTVMSPSAIRSS